MADNQDVNPKISDEAGTEQPNEQVKDTAQVEPVDPVKEMQSMLSQQM